MSVLDGLTTFEGTKKKECSFAYRTQLIEYWRSMDSVLDVKGTAQDHSDARIQVEFGCNGTTKRPYIRTVSKDGRVYFWQVRDDIDVRNVANWNYLITNIASESFSIALDESKNILMTKVDNRADVWFFRNHRMTTAVPSPSHAGLTTLSKRRRKKCSFRYVTRDWATWGGLGFLLPVTNNQEDSENASIEVEFGCSDRIKRPYVKTIAERDAREVFWLASDNLTELEIRNWNSIIRSLGEESVSIIVYDDTTLSVETVGNVKLAFHRDQSITTDASLQSCVAAELNARADAVLRQLALVK
jgi:hypothetical protein